MIPLSKVEELILKHASLERELSSNTVEKNKIAKKIPLKVEGIFYGSDLYSF